MDPDSGPKNTKIINFVPDEINMRRVSFEEVDGEKCFALAQFNDCSRALVTCTATFNYDYDLLSCNIVVTMLDGQYEEISSHDAELSLSDLFEMADRLTSNEKEILSYDGQNVSSAVVINNHLSESPIQWILDSVIKDDDPNYMDVNDQMLDYLCTKCMNPRLYRSLSAFKRIEGISRVKIIKPINLMKKAV